MFLADYHTHTFLSPDSKADPLQMARAAREAGLRELCLTDHLDFLDAQGKFVGLGEGGIPWHGPGLAPAVSGPDFTLRAGVELGEAWTDPALAAQVAAQPWLDLVIGSVHNLSQRWDGVDFYYLHYDSEALCYAVLDDYFDCMEALVAMDCFDVLGHVIYPLRYMNGRDGNHVTLERYLPQLERIFRALTAGGRCMEINTCRGETVEDWRQVLALYRDCGGSFVTLGSDAHRPEDVGKGIPQAAALAGEYGLQLALYERRRPRLARP